GTLRTQRQECLNDPGALPAGTRSPHACATPLAISPSGVSGPSARDLEQDASTRSRATCRCASVTSTRHGNPRVTSPNDEVTATPSRWSATTVGPKNAPRLSPGGS